ncbi:MAG: DUF4357 domain-containing protein [Candidatus Gracilibacteria bacterium]|nr:DUF4357 domain-containing protein [Candidatus Gracilibacteria bacterium]
MIVGLLFRHIKSYNGLNYIKFTDNYNFVSFVGNNGVGKSSILESLDYFFYDQDWNINKKATISGGFPYRSYPFVSPIFLINKLLIKGNQELFEHLNCFFRNNLISTKTNDVNENYNKHIKKLNDTYKSEEFYLFTLGLSNINKKIYFSSFTKDLYKYCIDNNLIKDDPGIKEDTDKQDKLDKKFHKVYEEICKTYVYLYFPVEINHNEITKLQTREMQGLMSKDIRDGIFNALGGNSSINKINDSLNSLVSEINSSMNGYEYSTINSLKNLQKNDLIDKIIESYFSKRILKSIPSKVSIDNFSSGEKRKALIDIAKFFLTLEKEKNKEIILAVDEPESSLHMNACFSQFESLKEISNNNQVFITTHWYGFLPIISKGNAHFLNKKNDDVFIESYDLYNIFHDIKVNRESSKGQLPLDTSLKSTNDLVQSIYYSISGDDTYNWLVCEGITEKIYFEYFLSEFVEKKQLIILPIAGTDKVNKLYKHLVPALENLLKNNNKCIFFLVDTDKGKDYTSFNLTKDSNVSKIALFKRLYNDEKKLTVFLEANDSKLIHPTEIENCLVPDIFLKTLDNFQEELTLLDIDLNKFNISGSNNTDFSFGFDIQPSESSKLKDFFDLYNGNMKIKFAEKYVSISKINSNSGIPKWAEYLKGSFQKSMLFEKDKKDEVKVINKENSSNHIYFLSSRGSIGKGIYSGEGFLVLKGSKLSNEEIIPYQKDLGNIEKNRKLLVDKGIILDGFFIEDYIFKTPTSACNIIAGGNQNGWKEWKNKDGKTLDEMERKNLKDN